MLRRFASAFQQFLPPALLSSRTTIRFDSLQREQEQYASHAAMNDATELQGEVERLQHQIDEKNSEIEKLKFDLLVGFVLNNPQFPGPQQSVRV